MTRYPATRPLAKVLLVSTIDNAIFCGPGMRELLESIDETGTVRLACKQMGMSYSKGWKLLRRLEQWLGCQVAVRQQGGKGGGEAHLTQEGREFLRKHAAFERDCQAAVEDVFSKHYKLE